MRANENKNSYPFGRESTAFDEDSETGGIRKDKSIAYPRLSPDSVIATKRSPLWRVQAHFPYNSNVYTHSDILIIGNEQDSEMQVMNSSGDIIWSGSLNQGEWNFLTSSETVYTVRSSGRISVIFDWGDQVGADFAPVHYAALQVDVVTPNGDVYPHGEVMLTAAHVTQLFRGVEGAIVTDRIEVGGPSDTLLFDLI